MREYGRERFAKYMVPFLIGFVAGVIVLNIGSSFFLDSVGLLDEYTLGRIKYLEINRNNFFIYVIKKRLTAVWGLTLLSSALWGAVFLYLYIFWLGASMGILLSAAIVRYGIKGILLIVVGCLPQILIYVPAMLGIFELCRSIWSGLYSPDCDISFKLKKKQRLVQWLTQFLLWNIVVIIGAAAESYVNPEFVTKLLKIF